MEEPVTELYPEITWAKTGEEPEINPFLNIYNPPKRGELAQFNQPLKQIEIPGQIKTLINRTIVAEENLGEIDVGELLSTPIITPSKPVLIQEGDIGIKLNIDILGTSTTAGKINPIQISNETGLDIPKNYRDARNNLDLIVSQRSGGKNKAYNIKQIKDIARNLGLASSGNKSLIVDRIRGAVIEYFKIQSD